ncbi:MAG: hypothetical protein FJW14_00685 [Acidimicrobiia bacterium]|nr:hypothetical protein [Acidimicrobiia bacterium]
MTGIGPAVAGSLALAALSTLADFIWATWITEHQTVYGLIHGTVLFLALGLVLGVVAGRPVHGAIGGAAVGVLGAAAFYVISPFIGFSAMVVAWLGIWLGLAALYGWLHGTVRGVAARGVVAALASGLAFYLISGIWRPFNPQGLDYAVHFGAWTVAFLPGFAALMLARR